jgi:hypothetical protein
MTASFAARGLFRLWARCLVTFCLRILFALRFDSKSTVLSKTAVGEIPDALGRVLVCLRETGDGKLGYYTGRVTEWVDRARRPRAWEFIICGF